MAMTKKERNARRRKRYAAVRALERKAETKRKAYNARRRAQYAEARKRARVEALAAERKAEERRFARNAKRRAQYAARKAKAESEARKETARRVKISASLKRHHVRKKQAKAQAVKIVKARRVLKRSVTPVKRRLVTKPKEMVAKITTALRGAIDSVSAPGRLVGVEINADNSVDGEIRFDARGHDATALLFEIEDGLTVPNGCWLSTGVRYAPNQLSVTEIERYTKFQGAIDVGGYYVKPSRAQAPRHGTGKSKIADHYIHVRETVVAGMERYGDAVEVFARLYWHPTDAKPQRRGA